MKEIIEEMGYETPEVEMIKVEVEQGFAVSNLENPGMGSESGW